MTETLAEETLRELYRPKTDLSWLIKRPLGEVRQALISARRFVLDKEMSAFLADLAIIPFQADESRRGEVLDSLRHGARLPHPKTWIEWNGHAFRKRMLEIGGGKDMKDLWGDPMSSPEDVPVTWGYLLEEHHHLPTAVRIREFMSHPEGPVSLPMEWCYSTLDEPLPWNGADSFSGMIGHGVAGYISPFMGMIFGSGIPEKYRVGCTFRGEQFITHKMAVEGGGILRYLLAFLATLNDIPTITETVRPQKGIMGLGGKRKFLDHTVIRLNLPQRTERTALARRLVVAARKRAHRVRGHWRMLAYQKPAEQICLPGLHVWTVDDENHQHCSVCDSKRTWILEHQRGDASLGFVTHTYSVGHRRSGLAE